MKRSHLLAIGMSLLFWICLLLILFGCSHKVHHRPRYNHWAKPYPFAPVKTHKPNLK